MSQRNRALLHQHCQAVKPTTGVMDSQELDEIHAFAVQLGKDAGQMLMQAAWRRVDGGSVNGASSSNEFDEKESSVDIVTKTDHAVEAFIRDSIAAKYPSHKFIGEETYSAGSSRDYLVDASPTWIVDPLDGTVNFTHLFPMFCVSIAFVVDHAPVIGVINAPFLHQLFSSCRGRGAWLNEKHRLPLVRDPVPPLPDNAPSGCIFSCEWGKDRREGPEGNLMRKVDSFVTMAAERGAREGRGGMVHGVRSLGSATMDLAYTAMGSLDIWWEGGCWEWDVAAGIAILEEAGGLVTTANPPDNPNGAEVPKAQLGSRLYLAIRPAGPSDSETALEAQHRVIRQVWKRVRPLSYNRPTALQN
ncbi:Inositol monophosphatase, metal-binding site [Purpureocillium lilacinum]|uniref:Inositol-1-monophosphatase n=1 Tax=Purpureocillium lilacinum TaxID=33203 RepID=A0A179GJ93_PURLI|nr:Inositol monophosphatase, metal-binding site [Purpureocillium lilacinum]OAQ77935.1 Inositol monophosphatase, metal-binding site [Purpureocillium lilacinum]